MMSSDYVFYDFLFEVKNYVSMCLKKSTPHSCAKIYSWCAFGAVLFVLSPTIAGPSITSPSNVNRLPWHGQSHVFSVGFQFTIHFMCVQTAEQTCVLPFSSLYTAYLSLSFSMTRASPG